MPGDIGGFVTFGDDVGGVDLGEDVVSAGYRTRSAADADNRPAASVLDGDVVVDREVGIGAEHVDERDDGNGVRVLRQGDTADVVRLVALDEEFA